MLDKLTYFPLNSVTEVHPCKQRIIVHLDGFADRVNGLVLFGLICDQQEQT